MYFFEKRFCLLILLFTIPLLFLPKINLIKMGAESETAGIRIDDIVLFFLAILFMWGHFLLDKKLYKIEGWVFLLTLFSLGSFFINKLLVSTEILEVHAKIFYAVRLLEYFLFFYIGALAAQFFPKNQIIRAFFLWNFFLIVLQKLNLIGGVTIDGYASNVSNRAQGVASFPSEMGLLLNLLFCYLIYDQECQSKILQIFPLAIRHLLKKVYLYWMFALFGILVIFTGNRISMLALLVCFLFKLKEEFDWKSITSLILISFVTAGLLAGVIHVIAQTEAVYQRSADLFTWRNFTLIGEVWNRIDLSKDPVGNEAIALEDYDVSWWLRIHKWMFALKTYVIHPECYLQGIGPGFAWSALDGGLLRILTEYGLIGCFIFWKLFATLYKINPQLKWMVIAFLINMIFFDAYLAYKTMSLLFFAAGHAYMALPVEKSPQLKRNTT